MQPEPYDHLPPWKRPTEYNDDRFGELHRPDRPVDALDDEPSSPEFFGVDDDDERGYDDDHAVDDDLD